MASSSAAAVVSVADPPRPSHSPRSSRQSLNPSPWSHVVRGDSDPSFPSPAEESDRKNAIGDASPPSDENPTSPDGHDHGGEAVAASGRGKKPAWTSKPSNGSAEMGAVMGAAWPALSESAKVSSKGSGPSDSPGSVPDAPAVAPSPAVPDNVASPKANSSNLAARNHGPPPVRQKSMRRGGAGGGSGNGSGVSSATGAQQAGGLALSPSSGVLPDSVQEQLAVPQISPQGRNSGNWDRGPRGSGSQFHGSSDHHRGHGGNRRGSNSGGGPNHSNYGNNREQERGNYNNYHHRGYGGREAHMQQWSSRPYFPPPQTAQLSSPYMNHVTMVRPYGNMLYADGPPVFYLAPQQPTEQFPGLPFTTYPQAPPAYVVPQIDPQRASLLKQIEYYFSNENLCKDTYLRQQMDEQGWILASVIAGFNRVKALTDNISVVLETVRQSDILEVQGDKMRRRRDWMNWVLPPNNSSNAVVSGQQIMSTPDIAYLSDSLQTVGLGTSGIENAARISALGEVEYSRSASGNISRQFRVVNDLNRDTEQMNSHGPKAVRSLSRSDTL